MAGTVAAVVVAAGRGLRAGGGVPKQYRLMPGGTAIERSLATFSIHGEVTLVQPVIHRDDQDTFQRFSSTFRSLPPVFGGATRQDSVRSGLEALAGRKPDIVLIHDAARPFASPSLITRAIAAAVQSGAAVPVLPLADTVKTVDAQGRVTGTLDRSLLRAVQTPQAFAFAAIADAHRRAQKAARDDFTDDAALAEWAGMTVSTFAGEAGNVKLTTPEDFLRAEATSLSELGDIRTGFGTDVHQFTDGDHIWLGGVKIPHVRGVTGHSDADVVLHSLVDAILGAISDGDIGVHFPPSDPQWRGASSDQFLAFAVERVRARGGLIAHLDITVVCEAPRVGPHRDAMRARIAEIAGVSPERVAIKATTSEKMGFTGRGEGIVAFANATVRLPWRD
ncbi:MAG: bifunctional 2-C-methyl-D-erythritol 4-phosphate cytidylyltransferase/2-C-methyl-D-erythritol 2,4-cyclodiphosphate synthase [Rhizobiales bacterium]|nr:bifunctional 2-C-methyl-D-erythritol 4-phosphate cytidylyltransferase/2-C-methyl-D-erythritol 2,4-cyclodiphosphate synthase [Hyphomicrobiales bacterium]